MTLPKKIRRVVIDVHHEDGSSAHITINEHVDFKTNFEAPEYRVRNERSLRPQPTDRTIFTISGVEQYNLTYFPTEEEKLAPLAPLLERTEPISAEALASQLGDTPVLAVPGGWAVGQLVKIPARFNKPEMPHAKRSHVWKVIEIVRHEHGGYSYTVELRDGSAKRTFMHRSQAYSDSAKVQRWPFRKGDFVTSTRTGLLYKVTGPAKIGDLSRNKAGRPEVKIALSPEDGPAVWLIDERGNEGWTPESDLRPVEAEVEVVKSQTWKVKD